MSNDTNREAFEAWAKPFAYSYCEAEGLRSAWHESWQASRKQAFKDAAAACKEADLNAYVNGDRLTLTYANHIIESLK